MRFGDERMFCRYCGAKLPDGESKCLKCGCENSGRLDSNAPVAVHDALGENSDYGKPNRRFGTRAVVAVVLVSLVVILAIAIVPRLTAPSVPQPPHTPTAKEIEESANAAGEGTVLLQKQDDEKYDEYRVLYNGAKVGSLYINENSSTTVSIYIDRPENDGDAAFNQVVVGAIRAVDQSQDNNAAKEILEDLLQEEEVTRNEVKYKPSISDWRHVLRIKVSDSSSVTDAPSSLPAETSATTNQSAESPSSSSVAVPSKATFQRKFESLYSCYLTLESDEDDYLVYDGSSLVGMVAFSDEGITALVYKSADDSASHSAFLIVATVMSYNPSMSQADAAEVANKIVDRAGSSSGYNYADANYVFGTAGGGEFYCLKAKPKQ